MFLKFKTLNEWRDCNAFINGFPAIENKTSLELSIFGKHGEVYEYSPGDFRALVTTSRVANQICKLLGKSARYKGDEEAIIAFGPKNFSEIDKLLKLAFSRGVQLRYANGAAEGFSASVKEAA